MNEAKPPMVRIPLVFLLTAALAWGTWMTMGRFSADACMVEQKYEIANLRKDLRDVTGELRRANDRLDKILPLLVKREARHTGG